MAVVVETIFHIVATGLYFHRISEVILYHNKWAMVKVKNSLPTLILIFSDLHHPWSLGNKGGTDSPNLLNAMCTLAPENKKGKHRKNLMLVSSSMFHPLC